MLRLFNFRIEDLMNLRREMRREITPKRPIFAQTEIKIPLEIIVTVGKRYIVGVAEFGDKTETIVRPLLPFMIPPEPEEIAKELLKKLGVPESVWYEILKTKREMET